nr:catalase-related domain-containing protein [Halosolutus halophilus]
MSAEERDRLVGDMTGVSDETIQARQVEHFYEADPETGHRIAESLGLDIETVVDDDLLVVEDEIPDAGVVADLLE